jgi:hypothetical protein
MKITIIALLLSLAATPIAHAQAGPAAINLEQPSPVRLFVQDRAIAFPEAAQPRLREQLTSLLKSSNFHSGLGDKYRLFTSSGVHQDYRDAIATGEYLLMIVSPVQKINTAGGEISVAEIVVGLRSPGAKNSVFTIDESGTIISHAKYSGEMYLELKKTVAYFRS